MAVLSGADAIDWGTAIVTIRTPRASFCLDAASASLQSFRTDEAQVTVSVGPDSVAVELHSTVAEKYLYAAALLEGGAAVIGAISGEKAVMGITPGARAREIRAY